MNESYDIVIIGSGPNGLSAGILLAETGLKVLIIESAQSVGGGMRTEEITLSGYKHDICSAIHPMGYLSPFFNSLPLNKFGLEWIIPEASVAHPLLNKDAVILNKSLEETASNLGKDESAYKRLLEYFTENYKNLITDCLKPLGIPNDPLLMFKFGIKGLQPAIYFANNTFKTEEAKALFAGCAAHSILPLNKLFTSAVGLIFLVTAHIENWAFPKGGSVKIAEALEGYFRSLGGQILLNTRIKDFKELPTAKKYIFDTDPIQLANIAEEYLPNNYKRRLRNYNYGPGVFKIDYALSEPIPWYDPSCLKASTVHLGGTLKQIAQNEKAVWNGKYTDNPFVILCQQSLFDESRAPGKNHTGWAYCHVPNSSTKDYTYLIENQIEQFAPGFKDTILSKHTMSPSELHSYNPNYYGGAVTGGAADLTQLFSRPVLRSDPYSTPNPDIYICSASSPPGGGVHGMCGYYAAISVLKSLKKQIKVLK